MTQLLLVNPNTNAVTTAQMLEIAREAAPAGTSVVGSTVRTGVPLITRPETLRQASWAVCETLRQSDLACVRGIIVAAFGDPGVLEARRFAPCPVTGIAEAGMQEAAQGGRRFAVATTTPHLAGAIAQTALGYGHGAVFAGVFLTPGEPAQLMADPVRLADALGAVCRQAIAEGGAEAVVIGGGPLARAARALAGTLPVPIVEPVPAAVRLALRRAAEQDGASAVA